MLWACADDAGARALARRTLERGNTRVVLYGTGDDAQVVLHDGVDAAARTIERLLWLA